MVSKNSAQSGSTRKAISSGKAQHKAEATIYHSAEKAFH